MLDWVDATGKVERTDFQLTWAGDVPASLELVDPQTLNTTVERDDTVIAHASRRLSDDGTQMEVQQRGLTANGKPFTNRVWYQRQR